MTDLADLLARHGGEIVAEAGEACARAHLAHYGAAPAEQTRARLRALLDVVVRGCRSNSLDDARSYGAYLALDRRGRGYGLDEVQVALNAAEAAVWRFILCRTAGREQAMALGRVSTILGAVKDSLACGYARAVPPGRLGPLELAALFAGTEANGQVLEPAMALHDPAALGLSGQ